MIQDPITTIVQNVTGTGIGTEFYQTIDMQAFGPGSQTTRKGSITGIPGLVVNCKIQHEATKSGRRRSSMRMDAVAAAGTTIGGVASDKPRSASAYLVVDRLESETLQEKLMVDVAVGALVNILVKSKVLDAKFIASDDILDFLRGEP